VIYAAPPPHPHPPIVRQHHGYRDDHNFNRDRLYFGNGARWDYGADYLDVTPAWWTTNTQWIVLDNGEYLWRAPSGALLRVHRHH